MPSVSRPVTNHRINYTAAAAHLGVKITTLRSMVHRKQVPHIRLGRHLVVFDVAQLDEWLRQCTVPTPCPASVGIRCVFACENADGMRSTMNT